MSVPVVRESKTSSASPIAASQAPIVSRRMHTRPMFIEVQTKIIGTINTSLSVIPSSINSDINKCEFCIMNAISIISGIK